MKFSIAALSSLLGAAVALPAASSSSNATLPAAFTLVADGGNTVVTDGSNLYYGGSAQEINSKEILILRSGANGAVSFTSKDGVPTAFQNLYIQENSVEPVALTVPHSGDTRGGDMLGFGVNEKGYFTHDGKAWFAVDGYGQDKQKEVFWYGAHNAEYAAANLWVKECKGC